MSDDVDHRKRALRAELRERRRIMTVTERDQAERALTANLIALAESSGASTISAYLSTTDEPSTRGFLRWAAEAGIRVLLPVSRDDGLLDWAPHEGEDEDTDLLGMPTPTSELLGPIAINEVDLIIVPASAVDRSGMRMGWGRGYFDKTLGSMQSRPPVYAVVFDHELVESVPTDVHDQRVDGAVTPSGVVALPAD